MTKNSKQACSRSCRYGCYQSAEAFTDQKRNKPWLDLIRVLSRFCTIALVFFCSLLTSNSCFGQGGGLGRFGTLGGVEPTNQYPSQQYYVALEIYRTGDLEEATEAFEVALRSTRRDINGRWIDAIPVYAMLGECYWQMGVLPKVRENVDSAIGIAIARRGWLAKVNWDNAVRENVQLSTPQHLWPEAASVKRIPVKDKLIFQSGQILTEQVLQRGGVIEERNDRAMDIVEIMRGLAIASYRRRVLLGPLSGQDSLSATLVESVSSAGMPQPIAKAMIGSVKSTARFANNDDKRTIEGTGRYSLLAGRVHPISSISLLTQATAIADSVKAEGGIAASIATANVAAALGHEEMIGEAMQLAAGCASSKEAIAVQSTAERIATSMVRESRLASVHCYVAAADAAVTAGNLDAATMFINHAKTLSDRRDVWLPRIEAYGSYVAARLAAARGEAFSSTQQASIDNAFGSMQSFIQNNRIRNRTYVSMPSLYQAALASNAVGKQLGGNSSDSILSYYSSDPSAGLWRRDAVDAFAFLMADRSAAHLARLALAVGSSKSEPILIRTDELLAERFAGSLPLAGRIAHVRALAKAEDDHLSDEAKTFRNKTSQKMRALRASVSEANLAAPDAAAAKKRGAIQESLACQIALSRLSIPRIAPPRISDTAMLDSLPPKTALVTFVYASSKIIGTLTLDGTTISWTIAGSPRINSQIVSLLRGVGVGKTRGSRLPDDESWKEDATLLASQLFGERVFLSKDKIDHLIIVPDGPLWYLPFELLEIEPTESVQNKDQNENQNRKTQNLGRTFSISYAATPGLALRSISKPAKSQTIGFASSRFFAPRELELNEMLSESIVEAADSIVSLPSPQISSSSMMGNQLATVLVAAPTAMDLNNPLSMSLLPYAGGDPSATLDGWMHFPSQVPETVVLAGYRTRAESAKVGDGRELFIPICALQTAGVRNVMLSRWAVGGESTAIAIRELIQELPYSGLAGAWDRAKKVLRRSELNPEHEPLLMHGDKDREALKGSQPLFWSGYFVAVPIESP